MNELSALAAVLTSLKSATDIAKILRESAASLKDAETRFKLADLLSALADVKTELAGVQDTIRDQQRTIRELNEKMTFAGKMEFDAPYFWNVTDGKREGPYCQKCWEDDKKSIHLYLLGNGYWVCAACKTEVIDSSHRPPAPPSQLPPRGSY